MSGRTPKNRIGGVKMSDDIGGVWRTVGGRRIFIKDRYEKIINS